MFYLSLQGTEKETPLQVKVALVNVNFPYKMVIYTQFQSFHCVFPFSSNKHFTLVSLVSDFLWKFIFTRPTDRITFPGALEARIQHSYSCDLTSVPGQGTKILLLAITGQSC